MDGDNKEKVIVAMEIAGAETIPEIGVRATEFSASDAEEDEE